MSYPKIVDEPHYHLWTDALHGRALAKQAKNPWDRGTYVRWCITTTWTVLEMACENALEETGIGRRFREHLDAACSAKRVPAIDWGRGVWQQVSKLHDARKKFVHINPTRAVLFPDVDRADWAVATARDAIRDIFARSGKKPPAWLSDDEDRGWDTGRESMIHAQSIHGSADPEGEDTIRLAYEYKDREFICALWPAGTSPGPLVDDLIQRLRIPVTAIPVYRGHTLIDEKSLRMRGT
jgi:hypothetical protein